MLAGRRCRCGTTVVVRRLRGSICRTTIVACRLRSSVCRTTIAVCRLRGSVCRTTIVACRLRGRCGGMIDRCSVYAASDLETTIRLAVTAALYSVVRRCLMLLAWAFDSHQQRSRLPGLQFAAMYSSRCKVRLVHVSPSAVHAPDGAGVAACHSYLHHFTALVTILRYVGVGDFCYRNSNDLECSFCLLVALALDAVSGDGGIAALIGHDFYHYLIYISIHLGIAVEACCSQVGIDGVDFVLATPDLAVMSRLYIESEPLPDLVRIWSQVIRGIGDSR